MFMNRTVDSTAWRRGRPHRHGIKAWFWAWQSSFLLLWQFSWRHRYTWLSMQTCLEPSCETSRFKRVHQPCLQCSGHSGEDGTRRSCSKWRKMPRQLHFYSMAWEMTFSMGCHSLHNSCCFLLDRDHRAESCWQEMLKIHQTVLYS